MDNKDISFVKNADTLNDELDCGSILTICITSNANEITTIYR
jgi:hypothetical protein